MDINEIKSKFQKFVKSRYYHDKKNIRKYLLEIIGIHIIVNITVNHIDTRNLRYSSFSDFNILIERYLSSIYYAIVFPESGIIMFVTSEEAITHELLKKYLIDFEQFQDLKSSKIDCQVREKIIFDSHKWNKFQNEYFKLHFIFSGLKSEEFLIHERWFLKLEKYKRQISLNKKEQEEKSIITLYDILNIDLK